jgi:hypothetical protein
MEGKMPIPDTSIGASEIESLRSQAASGNADAQTLLNELGHGAAPDKGDAGAAGDGQAADGSNSDGKASGTTDANGGRVEGEGSQGGRRNDDSADGKESVFDTIRQLRRDRRTLREENSRLKTQVEQVLAKMNDFMSKGGSGKEPTDAKTDTADFFSDPDKVLRSREEKLAQTILARVKDYLGNSLDRKSEGSEAVRILKSMPGYDANRDEHELLDLMEEHGLDVLARHQPMKAAILAKKLWQERNKLSPDAAARKGGAASGGAGSGGGVGKGTKKLTLEELNKQAKEASARGDSKAMDEIMAKIGELVEAGA